MDINADIVPNVGLGGFLLRNKITEYLEVFVKLKQDNAIEFEQTGLFEACYKIKSCALEVYVDIRNSKVYKIAAVAGYKGGLNHNIYVGMSIEDAFTINSDLYFREADSAVLCKNTEGIAIDLGVDDPWPEEIMELNVDSIVVFAPEVFSALGQCGN